MQLARYVYTEEISSLSRSTMANNFEIQTKWKNQSFSSSLDDTWR